MFFLVGCATPSSKGLVIDVTLNDDIENHKFIVSFTNEFSYQLCLSPGMWPNNAGKLDFAKDRVYVNVKGEVFPVKDFNTGYCPGCTLRVQPGESIEGFISYSDFGMPKNLYESEKQLHFAPVATACKE